MSDTKPVYRLAEPASAICGVLPVYGPPDAGAPREGHPVSIEAARARTTGLVGIAPPRAFFKLRRQWWASLRAAKTPEEKLTCQRMIDGLSEAIGLLKHEGVPAMIRENWERYTGSLYDEDTPDRSTVDAWR